MAAKTRTTSTARAIRSIARNLSPRFPCIGLLLGVLAASSLWAGPLRSWSIDEISQASVLLVGRVARVTRGPVLPDGQQKYPHRVESRTADVEILRLFTRDKGLREILEARRSVAVDHYGYASGHEGGMPGNPIWPRIVEGDVRLFPLRPDGGANRPMRLLGEDGAGIAPPAFPEYSGARPPGARGFVESEVANALVSGDPGAVLGAATYLRDGIGGTYQQVISADTVKHWAALIGGMTGENRAKQIELAAGLLASQGVPRPAVAEFLADDFGQRPNTMWLRLTSWALRQVPAGTRQQELITTLVRNATALPQYAWGAAVSLIEFSDDPLLVSELRRVLRERRPGALYVAWSVIRAGQPALLADAIPYAKVLIDPPDGDPQELRTACWLLRDFGERGDFAALLSAIRKYQSTDPPRYRNLWDGATYSDDNPREIEVLALYLPDRRTLFGDYRFRDMATARLQQLSGQDFGSKAEQPPGEREPAALKADAWLAEQVRLGKIPPPAPR